MNRKRFLQLPKDARDEILKLQVDNALYRLAIDDWCDYYRALRRMQVPPGDPIATHWTIKQLLDVSSAAGEHTEQERRGR